MKELDGRVFFWIPIIVLIIFGAHLFYLSLSEVRQKDFLIIVSGLFIVYEFLVNFLNVVEQNTVSINKCLSIAKFSILFWLMIIIIEINIWCKKRLTIKIR